MANRRLWGWTTLLGIAGVTVVSSIALLDVPGDQGFKMARLVKGPVSTVARLAGSLQPRRRHNVVFASNGRVADVLVRVGTPVHRGQLLGVLDAAQARFAVTRREFELRRAQLRAVSSEQGDEAQRRALVTLDVEQAAFE